MTDEEKKRMDYLERVEKAAQHLIKSFTNSMDYDSWDKALDRLETILKEKS